jgi:hypothetical protein
MAENNDPLVRFVDIQKSYDGEILVIKDLNMDVTRGEFLTILIFISILLLTSIEILRRRNERLRGITST